MRAEKLFSDAGLDPKKTAFSPSEIARALCVSGETVRAMTRSGHLEHFRIGGQIRIPRGAAFALVETHYVEVERDALAQERAAVAEVVS